MNKHNQVMGFEMHGVQIDENQKCNDVRMGMDTLNLDIAKEQDKT